MKVVQPLKILQKMYPFKRKVIAQFQFIINKQTSIYQKNTTYGQDVH